MGDRYPDQNESRWVFVSIGATFWVLAFLLLKADVWPLAILLFLIGVSLVWPNLFWGRGGMARLHRWFAWLRALFWL